MFICFSESSACALKASLKLLSIIGGFNKTWCLSRREDKEHSCDLFPCPVIATLTVSRGLLQVAGVGSSNLKLQWIVLLAYQIYSNSGLNSPGVLKVFVAMNIFILVSFVSALLFLLLELQISVHCSTQLLKDLVSRAFSPLPQPLQRIPSIYLVPFCLHKQEHADAVCFQWSNFWMSRSFPSLVSFSSPNYYFMLWKSVYLLS